MTDGLNGDLDPSDGPRIDDLSRTIVRMVGVDGVAVAVMSGATRELVYASDAVAQYLDELQFTTGQGPCVDTFHRGTATEVPDLAAADLSSWPGFAADAIKGGAAAIFAFPLRGGSSVFGVLELYRSTRGPLGAENARAAQFSADAVASALLREHLAPEAARERGDGYDSDGRGTRRHVNLAVGMISVQLGVSPAEALARLRAAAYAERRPIDDLARAVVDRTARFVSDDTTSDSTTKGQQS